MFPYRTSAQVSAQDRKPARHVMCAVSPEARPLNKKQNGPVIVPVIVAAWHLMATIVWVRPGAPADQVALASRVHAELVVPSFAGTRDA